MSSGSVENWRGGKVGWVGRGVCVRGGYIQMVKENGVGCVLVEEEGSHMGSCQCGRVGRKGEGKSRSWWWAGGEGERKRCVCGGGA